MESLSGNFFLAAGKADQTELGRFIKARSGRSGPFGLEKSVVAQLAGFTSGP